MEGLVGGNVTHVTVQLSGMDNKQSPGRDFPVEWLRNGTEDGVAWELMGWVAQ